MLFDYALLRPWQMCVAGNRARRTRAFHPVDPTSFHLGRGLLYEVA